MTQLSEILERLESLADPRAVEGMVRFGISSEKTLGVSVSKLRTLAKEVGRNHLLAEQLWASGIHEARILASIVDDPTLVTEKQMEQWVRDFDSWDICDQVCSNLFDKTRFAFRKASEWSRRPEEYVKRAGFVLMAVLSMHDKKAKAEAFLNFLPLIKRESVDERNFVRKAVNWALRQVGKRNLALNKAAVQTAREIERVDSKGAKWVAADALRELTSAAVQERLKG